MSYLTLQLQASVAFAQADRLLANAHRLTYQYRHMESMPIQSGFACMNCKSRVGCACWMELYGLADERALYVDLKRIAKILGRRAHTLRTEGNRIINGINETRQFYVINEWREQREAR